MPTPPAFTADELARRLGATLIGPGAVTIHGLDALAHAGEGALTFIRGPRYAPLWPASRAAAALVSQSVPLPDLVPGFDPDAPDSPRPLLVVKDAEAAMIAAIDLFAPPPSSTTPGIHPAAHVDPAAHVHPSAAVGPGCVIAAGAAVGEHAVLTANVFVGSLARVGPRSTLHAGVALMDRCVIGADCIIHANAVIGADGFGYRPAPGGKGVAKIPHIGNVVLHDHVEVGAGTCIDRAKFGSTLVGQGSKIDNLVQIGHNCRIGRACLICGQAGLAGSVVLGDGVILAGKVGVADNVEIGAGAKIGALSGVTGDVPPGAIYLGNPAGPAGEWRRTYATLRRLGKTPDREP